MPKMKRLPPEMVLKIGLQLTVEDLTRCCGVSREWREAFNQDRLWRPHCDPTLEEVLRATPCVAEPKFEIPASEGSMLVPLCQWRAAFLREKHLKCNWKNNNHRTETLKELKNEIYREFLTNTLLIRWLTNCFEVWDVSGYPAVFVVKTDPNDDISGWIDCHVENGLLIVRQTESVKVFFVDVANKSVQLKQNILLEDVRTVPLESRYHQDLQRFKQEMRKSGLDCVKGNHFLHINARKSKIDIFDLETGLKIKEEACPILQGVNVNQNLEISGVFTSLTSDFVIVIVKAVNIDNPRLLNCYYYVYNPRELSFVHDCLTRTLTNEYLENDFELHSRYFAIKENEVLTVYDCQSFQALLRAHGKIKIGFYSQGSDEYFITKSRTGANLEMFDLQSQTTESLRNVQLPGGSRSSGFYPSWGPYVVLNNRLLAFCSSYSYLLLENVWTKCDLPFERSVANQAFTKVLSTGECARNADKLEWWSIDHYW